MTMKNNSKNRKLKYIREKNHYRFNGWAKGFFKASNEIVMSNIDEFKNIVRIQSDEMAAQFRKKFKFNFYPFDYEVTKMDDDSIQDLWTVSIGFKVINPCGHSKPLL